MNEPAFLIARFGAHPLPEYLSDSSILGVARFVIKPSFSGESINTFIYRTDAVSCSQLNRDSGNCVLHHERRRFDDRGNAFVKECSIA